MWSTIYNIIIRCSTRLAPNEVISGYFVAPIRMASWPKVNLDQFQNLNIVQNNMFIIKGVVSGHYSHISQFTHKCLMWTVIINEDEEGRYVYRSEIWQALKFDFHK